MFCLGTRPGAGQIGRCLLLHSLDKALRPHVGPVPVDVVEAGGPAVRLVNGGPALGHLLEGRPQRMLSFVVDQDVVGGVLVLERVGHVFLRVCRFVRRLSSVASALPIFAAGTGSIMVSCAQSIRWTFTRPVT